MRKFAVIGLGQFGYQVAVSLGQLGAQVLAMDRDPDICEAIKHHEGVHPLCLDATDERALRASGIEDVETAVVAIGQHLEVSVVVTALLARIPVRRIVARSSNDLHRQILELIGATRVHNPEVEMAVLAAQELFAPDMRRRMQLPTGHYLLEIEARESLWGKTLKELDFRSRFELTIIALRKRVPYVDRTGASSYRIETNLFPGPPDVVEEGDVVALVGTEARIREFLEL